MFRLPIVKFFNRIFNRVTITVVLVALQVLWLLWAFWSFTAGRVWLNGALKALSIMIVLYLVRKDENSAYKIGWIVLIGLLPLLGGALYLAFGNKAPAKYLRERMQKVEQAHQTELAQPEGQTDALDISSRNLSRYVAKFGPYPAWKDTAAHYFSCGEEMYPQLLADLDKAEKFIFLEFFILRSGKMWNGVEQILRRKAAQGVDVRLIYDDFGSLLGLPSDFVIRMEKAHIRCIPFNPVVPLVSLVMNHRDHRKIVVVDGNVAYTGGVNLADEYINAEQRFGYWKDAAIRLEGAAVWNFTVMFLTLWDFLTKTREPDYERFRPQVYHPEPFAGEGFVAPFTDSPMDGETVGENVYYNLIAHASHYVYITTPYLILDYEMTNALCTAAKSGVDVRIITPYVWDKFMVYMLTQSNYPALLEAGVKIYEYTPGFVHAKSFVVDDELATVGTINLDYRSLYLHFECGCWMYKTPAVMDIKADLLKTMEECHRFTMEDYHKLPLYRRLGGKLLKLFAPLL